ncbi:30S ribosome-binding factor RbfA [Anaerosporobacter faecicola]|uniref:30S ribosome-binding factor RbfA n=1 Tax=Anaerosporobacter faecicola TaxID=2718714 RepID=UPI0014393E21|nr:30S ribosome-binding factor RbfA [Anaerosporobacter faecicola]
MRKNSIKNTRINGEVQKELSVLISREIKDPRISPMTSVVAVEVAPDLKHAKVYISVLGDEEKKQSTFEGLRSAAPYLRTQLAKTVNLRNTPELTFVMDQSIEYGVNMSKLIDDVNKNLTDDVEDVETDSEEDNE